MKKYICIVLLFTMLVCMTLPAVALAETTYSNVLDDLKKDVDFNVADYPKIRDDYSLQVIQIAESIAGELFVYVYQPSGKLVATSIHLAQETEPDTADTHEYKLTLLNNEDTLFKYKVEGIKLKNSTVRYYDITSIFRPWDAKLDVGADNDNETNEVAFEVAQLWTVTDTNEGVEYAMTGVETIKILNPYHAFLRYDGGYILHDGACDSHFIAFDTDKPIDKLLEASVYFTACALTEIASWNILKFDYEVRMLYEKQEDKEVALTYDEVGEYEGGGLFGKKYTWNRICTTQEFIANEPGLTKEAISALSDTRWVLRFADYGYSLSGKLDKEYTLVTTYVSDVTILRLKFETDGVVYNLGTVMNKQTGHGIFVDINIPWWVWLIVVVVVLAIVASLVKPVATIIVWALKIIWWIICVPFKLIGLLFRRDKK